MAETRGGRKSEWISVKDGLPQINTAVLVYIDEYGICIDFYTVDYNNPKKPFFAYRGNRVTHWMPLPEPPKEAEK